MAYWLLFIIDRVIPFEYIFYRIMIFKVDGIIPYRIALRIIKVLLPYKISDRLRVIKDSFKFIVKNKFKK